MDEEPDTIESHTERVNTPIRYQFVIDGELSERAQAAFPDLTFMPSVVGSTTMYGAVGDPIDLRGILDRLESLGLTIVELRRLPD